MLIQAIVVALSVSSWAAEGAGQAGKKGGGPQPARSPQEMAEKMVEGMDRRLKLTSDQKAKVREIIKGSASEMEEIRKRMQKLEREVNEKIRVLLDDEQKESFDMMRAHRKMGMGGQGMRGQGRKRGQGQQGQGAPEGGDDHEQEGPEEPGEGKD